MHDFHTAMCKTGPGIDENGYFSALPIELPALVKPDRDRTCISHLDGEVTGFCATEIFIEKSICASE